MANLYHGLQYFGIVWVKEKRSITRAFRLPETGLGAILGFGLFVMLLFALGMAQMLSTVQAVQIAISLFTVVSLMHFWYDGFIWSVRKGEI